MSPTPTVDIDLQGVVLPAEPLVESAHQILEFLGLGAVELSILLCTDTLIQTLNRDYRGLDSPTDVLSFAQREGEDGDPDDPMLGDVVISVDTACRQAAKHGHALEIELQILLVHGVLHLLGYDHIDESDAVEMRIEEQRVLDRLSASTAVALIARETS